MFTLALVGRPNVGKSTLFNRLSDGKNKAIVHDLAGITRDRKYAKAKLNSLRFTIIDTPGFTGQLIPQQSLSLKMDQQTLKAIEESDLIAFILDGKSGVVPHDFQLAKLLRSCNKPVIPIVNKCEQHILFDQPYFKLGLGDPIQISAAHGIGKDKLYQILKQKTSSLSSSTISFNDSVLSTNSQITIAIVGRPNSGKSTFVNTLINQERLLTSAESGTTRESIGISWTYKKQLLKLVDTAGLRKKSNVKDDLEKSSALSTIQSIKFASTVVLMVDATRNLEQQDLNIANLVLTEGRNLVLVINKIDLIKDISSFKKEIEYRVSKSLSQFKGLLIVFISALQKFNINNVLDACLRVYLESSQSISTNKLNSWLQHTTRNNKTPRNNHGRLIKLKYCRQINVRPPTIKIFANFPDQIPDDYKHYLVNNFREYFKIPGIPIRLRFVASSTNPYIKDH